MYITHFTIMQDGKYVGSVAVMGQAVRAARNRAARTGRPVSVTAHINDGHVREIVYYPNGAVEILWDITTEFQRLWQGEGGASK